MAPNFSFLGLFTLLFLLSIGTTLALPADSNPLVFTSALKRDTIGGVRNAAEVPGTQLVTHECLTDCDVLKPALPMGMPCFHNKCYGVDRHWVRTANDVFCKKANGMVFNMAYQNTSMNMTYAYQPQSESDNGERGQVFMQIGFALGADPKVALTMTYSMCMSHLMDEIIDLCDSKSENHKHGGADYPNIAQGGLRGNDALFYAIDPNPRTPGDHELCGSDYWLPWLSNTKALGLVKDDCYDKWNGTAPDTTYFAHHPKDRPAGC